MRQPPQPCIVSRPCPTVITSHPSQRKQPASDPKPQPGLPRIDVPFDNVQPPPPPASGAVTRVVCPPGPPAYPDSSTATQDDIPGRLQGRAPLGAP